MSRAPKGVALVRARAAPGAKLVWTQGRPAAASSAKGTSEPDAIVTPGAAWPARNYLRLERMATVQRSRIPGFGVAAVLLGVSLGTYAAHRLRVSQKLGNRVLNVLDLDEPLSSAPTNAAYRAPRDA